MMSIHHGLLLLFLSSSILGESIKSDTQNAYTTFSERMASLSDDSDMWSAMFSIGALMQGMSGPDGAPPFMQDTTVLDAMENIITTLGPFVCRLPKATGQELESISAALAGIVGNIIGDLVSEQLFNSSGYEDAAATLSGLGGIAGTFGSLTAGRMASDFEHPNRDTILNHLHEALSDISLGMGDMKSLIEGKFDPPPEMKGSIDMLKDQISHALNVVGFFVKDVNSVLTEKARSFNHADRVEMFPHVDDKFGEGSKMVSVMSGTIAGLIRKLLSNENQDNGFSVVPLKKNLMSMRKIVNGRSFVKEVTFLSPVIGDLIDACAKVATSAGAAGALIGHQFHTLEDDSIVTKTRGGNNRLLSGRMARKPNQNLLTDAVEKLDGMIKNNDRSSKDMEICLEMMAFALSSLSMAHQYGGMMPDSLDFKGPFGGKDDKVDVFSMRRYLVKNEFNGEWEKPPAEIEMAGNLKPEDFAAVFGQLAQHDNSVLLFIDTLARKHGLDSKLLNFLSGKIAFDTLVSEEVAAIPIAVYSEMKPSVIAKISAANLKVILYSKKSQRNPERLSKFLSHVPTEQFLELAAAVKNSETSPPKAAARVALNNLMNKLNYTSRSLSNLCSFATGISEEIMMPVSDEEIEEYNLIECFANIGEELDKHQLQFIVTKLTMNKVPSASLFISLGDLAGHLHSDFFKRLPQNELISLIEQGHIASLKYRYSKSGLKELPMVLLSRLNFSNSSTESLDLFRSLNLTMCGIPLEVLHKVLYVTNTSAFISIWVEMCAEYRYQEDRCRDINEYPSKGSCISLGGRNDLKRKDFFRFKPKVFSRAQELFLEYKLEDAVPTELFFLLSGLTEEQIMSLPPPTILRSLPLFSDDPQLSRKQRASLLKKLFEAGYEVDNANRLIALGYLASEIDLPVLKSFITNEAVRDSFANKLELPQRLELANLLMNNGINILEDKFGHVHGSAAMVRAMKEQNLPVTSHYRWSRAQAIAFVSKFKISNEKILVENLGALGQIASGLTCADIQHVPLEEILEFTLELDRVIGNDISSDLAFCLGIKLYLSFKMQMGKHLDVTEIVGNLLPGNILLLMPRALLESVVYGGSCKSMMNRLQRANFRLLSFETGFSTLGNVMDIMQMCYQLYMFPGLNDDYTNKPPPNSFAPSPPSSTEKGKPGFNSQDQQTTPRFNDQHHGNGRSDKDSFYEKSRYQDTHANQSFTYPEYDKPMPMPGKLACKVTGRDGLPHLVDAIIANPLCIPWLGKDGFAEIEKIVFDVMATQSDNLHALQSIVPVLPFMSESTLKQYAAIEGCCNDTDATKYFGKLLERRPARQDIVGDKTSPLLEVAREVFSIASDELEFPDPYYDPLNAHGYAQILAEKQLELMYRNLFSNNSKPFSSTDEDMLSQLLSLPVILKLGPLLLGLKEVHIQSMSNRVFDQSVVLLGQLRGWTSSQLAAIKTKMSMFGEPRSWPIPLLKDLGHLAIVLDVPQLNQLTNVTLKVVNSLAKVDWPSDSHRGAILSRYLATSQKSLSDLEGYELSAFRELLCGIAAKDISSLSSQAISFALSTIGNVMCFSEEKLSWWKNAALQVLDADFSKPSALNEMGILTAALTFAELKTIKPIHASIVSADALRVIPASKIVSGWNVSHFALLGIKNGGVVLSRKDVMLQLNNKSKNAVFRAAFAHEAAMVASSINSMQFGNKFSSDAFEQMMKKLQQSLSLVIKKVTTKVNKKKVPQGGLGSLYGLSDPTNFQKRPPSQLVTGLSKNDFGGTFNKKFLEDDKIIDFINDNAENDRILQVLKGSITLNQVDSGLLNEMPPKVLIGMKANQLNELSGSTLGILLDSATSSRDPQSVKRFLKKLDMTQLEDAMLEMNKKMTSLANDAMPWRPPVTIQEAVVNEYIRRLLKQKLSPTEFLQKFSDNMCPFVAGMTPHLIKNLPYIPEKVDDIVKCFSKSYSDFSANQRKQFVKWAIGVVSDSFQLSALRGFVLDVPRKILLKALTVVEISLIINNNIISELDSNHANFPRMSRLMINSLFENNSTFFDSSTNIDNLGPLLCGVPLGKLKKQTSAESMKQIAQYSMKQCSSGTDSLEESLEQCTPDQMIRLKRCKLFKDTLKKEVKNSGKRKRDEGTTVNVAQFRMMREIANTLLAGTDLTQMNSDAVRNVAGALGGLPPTDLDKLPDSAVLDALSSIKGNKNLNRKQKRIMFKKAQSAGFSVSNVAGLSDLGELLPAVPPSEFSKLAPGDIKNNLGKLKQQAAQLSPMQMKAIAKKLQELDLNELLGQDLGYFATEIPIQKLREMKNINTTLISDKPWDRGQAAKLIDLLKNASDSDYLRAKDVSEMGTALLGLKCSDIMEMRYDEVLEIASTIDSTIDLPPDMNECIQKKLHFSLQVDLGVDYMANESNSELDDLISSIPSNIAMFYSPKVVNDTPADTCELLIQLIGESQLGSLSLGVGDIKRKELAQSAMNCILKSHTSLTEDDLYMLGELICDIPLRFLQNISSDLYGVAIPLLKPCLSRLDSNHLLLLRSMVRSFYGSDTSQWSSDVLRDLGPIVSFMAALEIERLNADAVAEALSDILPPPLDSNTNAAKNIQRDAFFSKAAESLLASKEPEARRKRAVTAPTYDEIVALGPGNAKWSIEQLQAISSNDLLNSLEVLGEVDEWTTDQRAVLLQKLFEVYSSLSSWDAEVIAEAKHILTDLSVADISTLDFTNMVTVSSLSEIAWSKNQKTSALGAFLLQTSKTMRTLTEDDFVALDSLLCGATEAQMMELSAETVSKSVKSLGTITCYDQEQMDILYSLVVLSGFNSYPDAALFQEMKTIAGGMPIAELEKVPLELMPMIDEDVFKIISPLRISEGLSPMQLAAAGLVNIAAILNNPSIVEVLSKEQKEALLMAAYGRIADSDLVNSNNATSIQNDPGVNLTPTVSESSSGCANFFILLWILPFVSTFLIS